MIYLDNQSTTRVDPRVVEAMLPTYDSAYGNAGSITHEMGLGALDIVDGATDIIANAIGAPEMWPTRPFQPANVTNQSPFDRNGLRAPAISKAD